MAFNRELKNMQEYVADKLEQNGEFPIIEIGYRFPKIGTNRDNELNVLANRHIYAEREDGEKFLVVANVDKMSSTNFARKLIIASQMDVATAHVLYKYPNNEGPFWRREIREEERANWGEVAYRKKAAYSKESLAHLSHEKKNRIRKVTRMERELVKSISPGGVPYYQPKSERLDEKILKFKFIAPEANYTPYGGQYYMSDRRKLIEYVDPETIFESENFSLESNVLGNGGRKQLRSYVKEFNSKRALDEGILLTAEFVDINENNDRNLRGNLNRLNGLLSENLMDEAYDLAERLSIQLQDEPEDNEYVMELKDLLRSFH